MKRSLILSVLFFLALCVYAGNFGAGIMLGDPTGFNFKIWTNRTTAIDGGIAWSIGDRDALHIHVDYLFHSMNLIPVTNYNSIFLHYGIGGRFLAAGDGNTNNNETDNDSRLGFRVPIGLDYKLIKTPVDFFIEVAPILDFVPTTEFSFNGAIGARYYF